MSVIRSKSRRRIVLALVCLVVLVAGLVFGFVLSISHELPDAEPSVAADALAREMMARMWTEILPVDGLTATWEDWQTLDTGAVVSGVHGLPLGLELELTEIRGAATLAELTGGEDPFAVQTTR